MQCNDAFHDTGCELLPKNDAEQRPMHLQSAVVLEESKIRESIQENMLSRDASTDHFRGSPLSYS
jgi:hypothetical protein